MVVTDVVATCGCTVPVYSKRPVLPGERSEIAVTFDPMNRPGRFDKAVSVFTSESGDPIRLRITGRVTPRERSVEELYPCDLGGGLRAAATSHAFGYVRHAQPQRSAIGLANVSSEPIELTLHYGRRSGRLTASVPARPRSRHSSSPHSCCSTPHRRRRHRGRPHSRSRSHSHSHSCTDCFAPAPSSRSRRSD